MDVIFIIFFQNQEKIQYCCADNGIRGTDLLWYVVISQFRKAASIKSN